MRIAALSCLSLILACPNKGGETSLDGGSPVADLGGALPDSGLPPSADSGTNADTGAGADSGPIEGVDAGGSQGSSLQLLFQSGFEPDTRIDTIQPSFDRLRGNDRSVSNKGDWEADFVTENPYWGAMRLGYEDSEGDRDKRRAELVSEEGNQYLRYYLREAHVRVPNPHNPGEEEIKGRIQLGVSHLENLDAFTYKVKLRITGGFNAMAATNQPITWMTLAEFWNDLSSSETSARMHVAIHKDRSQGMFWEVTGSTKVREGNRSFWEDIEGFHFPQQAQDRVPVVLNEWLELTVMAKDGKRDGRFKASVARLGEVPVVIADYTGHTVHPDAPLDGFDSLAFLKLYTNGHYVDALLDAGAPALEIHWDDFQVWYGADFD